MPRLLTASIDGGLASLDTDANRLRMPDVLAWIAHGVNEAGLCARVRRPLATKDTKMQTRNLQQPSKPLDGADLLRRGTLKNFDSRPMGGRSRGGY